MDKAYIKELQAENTRVRVLGAMLDENVDMYCSFDGAAGAEYPKNHNASKAAILNQITTLRNELLVLAEKVKEA